jgi:hypothetical protein
LSLDPKMLHHRHSEFICSKGKLSMWNVPIGGKKKEKKAWWFWRELFCLFFYWVVLCTHLEDHYTCDVRGKEGLVTSGMHFNPNHMILLLLAKCNMGCTSFKIFTLRMKKAWQGGMVRYSIEFRTICLSYTSS